MTKEFLLTYTCLLVCLPIVVALSAGRDPMAGYVELFGLLTRAAEIGLEIRR